MFSTFRHAIRVHIFDNFFKMDSSFHNVALTRLHRLMHLVDPVVSTAILYTHYRRFDVLFYSERSSLHLTSQFSLKYFVENWNWWRESKSCDNSNQRLVRNTDQHYSFGLCLFYWRTAWDCPNGKSRHCRPIQTSVQKANTFAVDIPTVATTLPTLITPQVPKATILYIWGET